MTIQNSTYLPSRMSKKRYFYDSLLEKGILNTVYSLGRDSSMDDEDYQDVCFCPSNNKLYAVRTNSSDSTSHVDVICPNSTTKTCSNSCAGGPEATIAIENGGRAIVYCPSNDKIFVVSSQYDKQPLSKINPQDNTVEVVQSIGLGNIGAYQLATGIIYNPMTDLLYVSSGPGPSSPPGTGMGVAIYSAEGDFPEDDRGLIGESAFGVVQHGYSEITRMCVDPERNRIHLFDGRTYGDLTSSNYFNIEVDKNNAVSSTHVMWFAGNRWLDLSQKVKDVIYCPYDGRVYWLASSETNLNAGSSYVASLRETTADIRIIKLRDSDNLSELGPHDRLIYCPDNNMIYVLGRGNIHMINPADTYGVTPMAEFYDSGVGIETNGVCYSHINNRIYGVGDDGYIKYIDPTT